MSTTPSELKYLPATVLRNILQQFPDPERGGSDFWGALPPAPVRIRVRVRVRFGHIHK